VGHRPSAARRHTVDAFDPGTVAELEARANAMNADETVAFALDALERYLAAIEPDPLTTTKSA
jgi:hypothetical protein